MANTNLLKGIKEIGKLSGDGVFVYDLVEGKLLYSNTPFRKIFDSEESLLKKGYHFFKPFLKESEDYLVGRISELKFKEESTTSR